MWSNPSHWQLLTHQPQHSNSSPRKRRITSSRQTSCGLQKIDPRQKGLGAKSWANSRSTWLNLVDFKHVMLSPATNCSGSMPVCLEKFCRWPLWLKHVRWFGAMTQCLQCRCGRPWTVLSGSWNRGSLVADWAMDKLCFDMVQTDAEIQRMMWLV